MPDRFSSSSIRQISAIWLNLAHLILLATSSCLSRAPPLTPSAPAFLRISYTRLPKSSSLRRKGENRESSQAWKPTTDTSKERSMKSVAMRTRQSDGWPEEYTVTSQYPSDVVVPNRAHSRTCKIERTEPSPPPILRIGRAYPIILQHVAPEYRRQQIKRDGGQY